MTEDEITMVGEIIAEGKALRMGGDVDGADVKYRQAEEMFGTNTVRSALKVISRLQYEKAFNHNIRGSYDEAATLFLCSDEIGALCGNPVQKAVGKFRFLLTQYVGGALTPDTMRQHFNIIRSDLEELRADPSVAQIDVENAQFNLLKRTYQVAFDGGHDEFMSASEEYLNHPRMIAGLNSGEPSYIIESHMARARQMMVQGQYNKACEIFAAYIDEVTNVVTQPISLEQRDRLQKTYRTGTEEIARDYRDFGTALLHSNLTDSNAAAKAVWEAGVKLHPGRGNKRFINEMKALLEEHFSQK